jgi:hypothetical protein
MRQRKQPIPTFWDRFWRDKNGRDVIWQRPNAFLTTWFAATVISWFIPHGILEQSLSIVGFVAIVIWAVLELLSGVNNFRRTLGFLVLVIAILNRLR